MSIHGLSGGRAVDGSGIDAPDAGHTPPLAPSSPVRPGTHLDSAPSLLPAFRVGVPSTEPLALLRSLGATRVQLVSTYEARSAARERFQGTTTESDSWITNPHTAGRRREEPAPLGRTPVDIAIAAYEAAPAGSKPSLQQLSGTLTKAWKDLAMDRAVQDETPVQPPEGWDAYLGAERAQGQRNGEYTLALHMTLSEAAERGASPAAQAAIERCTKLLSTSLLDWRVSLEERREAAAVLGGLKPEEAVHVVRALADRPAGDGTLAERFLDSVKLPQDPGRPYNTDWAAPGAEALRGRLEALGLTPKQARDAERHLAGLGARS